MTKYIDHTGKTFGKLTVIEFAGHTKRNKAKWLCKCECGNTKVVPAQSLVQNGTTSCGCIRATGNFRYVDLSNRTFGKLTVIRYAGNNERCKAMWLCKCECGNEVTVSSNSLRARSLKSCGCASLSRMYPDDEKNWQHCYRAHKSSAKHQKSEPIPYELWKLISVNDCAICGEPPSIRKYRKTEPIYINGIDRIDSSKGYQLDNIQPCCTMCNRSKLFSDYSDFINHCKKIAAFNGGC